MVCIGQSQGSIVVGVVDVVRTVWDVNERRRKVEPRPQARERSALISQAPITNPPKYPQKMRKNRGHNSVHYDTGGVIDYREGGFMSIAVCPLPVVPSNTNKLDIGVSRALNAFKISCAKTPPTTAQTGENSCAAAVERDLEERYQE